MGVTASAVGKKVEVSSGTQSKCDEDVISTSSSGSESSGEWDTLPPLPETPDNRYRWLLLLHTVFVTTVGT